MRVGFIINSRLPSLKTRGIPPRALLFGWDDAASPMSFMRFRWIRCFQPRGITYELYRPWRSYAAVVFLKSMGPACMEAVHRLQNAGTAVVFEANVDYYSLPANEPPRMEDMVPSLCQRADAEQIAREANGVIASSSRLAQVCSHLNVLSHWVPDNILPELCRLPRGWAAKLDGKLQIWWSGMASKLFELLAAEESLLRFKNRIHLRMVTDDVPRGMAKWRPELRGRFESFLKEVAHTFYRFKSVSHLLKLYSTGGIIISPRFLESPYNLAHSEWKITLGMACGLPALGSPVPSYEDVAARAEGDAIRICREEGWDEALEWAISRPYRPSEAACDVVRRYYLTPVVAKQHWRAVQSALI